MSRIPDETLREILSRTDIVDLIGQYVPLKQAGRSFKGLCPFHQEKTPSFTVTREKQMFYCFGCQAGGNAIGFLMRVEGHSFPEAARQLASRVGVEIPREERTPEQDQRESLRASVLGALKEARNYYHQQLMDHHPGRLAREYLAGRGIDSVTMELFEMGYAPAGWDHLRAYLAKKGYSDETLVEAGLARASDRGGAYDTYRNRIIFPIANVAGEVLGFGGRAIDPEDTPKYINTSQTLVYSKGAHCFALDHAKDHIRARGRAVVVEGYMDCVRLHQHGFGETVASLGTALTEGQILMVARFTKDIILLFDADAAGQRAMLRVLPPFIVHDIMPRVATLPEGVKDPDELMNRGEEGVRQMEQALEHARPLMDHFIESVWAGSLRDVATKQAIAQEVLPLLSQMPSALLREHYLGRLASMLETPRNALLQEMRRASRPGAPLPVSGVDGPESPPSPTDGVPREEQWTSVIKSEVHLLGLLLYDMELAREVLDYDITLFFRHDFTRACVENLRNALSEGDHWTTEALLGRLPEGPVRRHLNARLVEGYYAQIADGSEGLLVEVVRSLCRLLSDFFHGLSERPEVQGNMPLFQEVWSQRTLYLRMVQGRPGHDLKALLPKFNEYLGQSLKTLGKVDLNAPV